MISIPPGSLPELVDMILTPIGGIITVLALVGLYFYLRWLFKD